MARSTSTGGDVDGTAVAIGRAARRPGAAERSLLDRGQPRPVLATPGRTRQSARSKSCSKRRAPEQADRQPRTAHDRDLAIIIVSYNARADLERCLSSLAAAPPSTTARSRGGRQRLDGRQSCGGRGRPTRRSGCSRSIGTSASAAANNVGIRATGGAAAAAAEQRHDVPAGAIDRLVAELDAHPEVAIVGPRLVDAQRAAGDLVRSDDRARSTKFARSSSAALYRAAARRPCVTSSGSSRTRARPRLGQRRVPAGATGGSGRGRPVRRAVLPLHGGRRSVRERPRPRPQGPVHAARSR